MVRILATGAKSNSAFGCSESDLVKAHNGILKIWAVTMQRQGVLPRFFMSSNLAGEADDKTRKCSAG